MSTQITTADRDFDTTPNATNATRSRDNVLAHLRECQKYLFVALRDLEEIHPVVADTEVYKQLRTLGQQLPEIMQKISRLRVSK